MVAHCIEQMYDAVMISVIDSKPAPAPDPPADGAPVRSGAAAGRVLARAKADLEAVVAGLEVGVLTGSEAVELVRAAVAVRNVAGVVEGLAAARVADTPAWRGTGARSPEVFLARQRGSSVGDAAATVDTARAMRDLPVVEQAWRAGRLSPPQAAAVASAASRRPEAQHALVESAESSSLAGLRRSCAEVLARGAGADERERRVHAGRRVTHRDLPEGGFEMTVRGTHASLATIRAGLATTHDRAFQAARHQGRHERAEAYLFDALELLCADAVRRARSARTRSTGAAPRPPEGLARSPGAASPRLPASKVIVRIDHAALARGHPLDGELCEVAGVGPVPVRAVREAMASGDPFVAAVVTKGVDVVSVTHLGRRPLAVQQTALEFASPTCSRLDCGRSARLEADHRLDWHHTHHTTLTELDLLCEPDHQLKTHHGHRLVPGSGPRPMLPPDELARQLPAEVVATLYTPAQLARFLPAVAARLATAADGRAPDTS